MTKAQQYFIDCKKKSEKQCYTCNENKINVCDAINSRFGSENNF